VSNANTSFETAADQARQDRRHDLRSHPDDWPARANLREHAMTGAREERRAPARTSSNTDEANRRERLIDEALTDTFPASDPPAFAMP